MTRNLFVIATPLHAYTALEIVNQELRDCENWFLLTSTGVSESRQLIECMSKVCESFKVIDASWCSPYGRTVIPQTFTKALIKARFFPNAKNELHELNETVFDAIFVFSPNALTSYLRYMHPETKISLGEDGIGSYDGDVYKRAFFCDHIDGIEDTGISKRLINLLNDMLFGGQLRFEAENLYVHCPELLRYDFPGIVHKITSEPSFIKLISSSLSINVGANDYRNYDIIFLGQPMDEIGGKESVLGVIEAIASSGMSWIYRPHPRERLVGHEFPAENDTGSWEARCMLEIDETTTLVSVCSTAMGMPKMLFDKEPRLIFVHRLIEDMPRGIRAKTDRFVESLIVSYVHNERILAPSSLHELCRYLLPDIRESENG